MAPWPAVGQGRVMAGQTACGRRSPRRQPAVANWTGCAAGLAAEDRVRVWGSRDSASAKASPVSNGVGARSTAVSRTALEGQPRLRPPAVSRPRSIGAPTIRLHTTAGYGGAGSRPLGCTADPWRAGPAPLSLGRQAGPDRRNGFRSAVCVTGGSETWWRGGRARMHGPVNDLAADEHVELVRLYGVAAGSAAHAVAVAIADVDSVVPGSGRDHVAAGSAVHLVRPIAGADSVLPRAAPYREVPVAGGDHVVVRSSEDRCVPRARANPVRARAAGHEIGTARVDAVGTRAAEETVGAGLSEQRVGARTAQDQIVARSGVDHVVSGPSVDPIVARAADYEVQYSACVDQIVPGTAFQVVAATEANQAIVAPLTVELVGQFGADQLVGAVRPD